jgi:hypothetical protein
MGSLAVAIVVVVIGYFLWRELRRQAIARTASTTGTAKRQATTLERDPVTGVYQAVERQKPPVSHP